MHTPEYDHVSYLRELIQPERLRVNISKAVAVLDKLHLLGDDEFDGFAVRGVSGLLIGPALSVALNKSILVVRKDEDNHSSNKVEGDKAVRRYIIVDDVVDTGNTARAIRDAIADFAPQAKCLGVLEVYSLKCEEPRLNTYWMND